jgi:hypothetical protein
LLELFRGEKTSAGLVSTNSIENLLGISNRNCSLIYMRSSNRCTRFEIAGEKALHDSFYSQEELISGKLLISGVAYIGILLLRPFKVFANSQGLA